MPFVNLRAVDAAERKTGPKEGKRDQEKGGTRATAGADFKAAAEFAHPDAGGWFGEIDSEFLRLIGQSSEAEGFLAGTTKRHIRGGVRISKGNFFCAIGTDDFHGVVASRKSPVTARGILRTKLQFH